MLLVEFLLDKLEEEGGLADIRVSDHDEFEDQRWGFDERSGGRFDVRDQSDSTCVLALPPLPSLLLTRHDGDRAECGRKLAKRSLWREGLGWSGQDDLGLDGEWERGEGQGTPKCHILDCCMGETGNAAESLGACSMPHCLAWGMRYA